MKNATEKNKSDSSKSFGLIAVGFILVFIIILLIFLLRGETKISGEYPDDYKDKSLVCKSEGIAYPYFTYDKSDKKDIEINAIFDIKNLRSISLKYNLYYSDTKSITGSEAFNRAAMNKSFGADGLDTEALGINYSKLSDRMSGSLYTTASKINYITAKYFMIDRYSDYSIPDTIEGLKQNYENKGFTCQISE